MVILLIALASLPLKTRKTRYCLVGGEPSAQGQELDGDQGVEGVNDG